MQLWSGSLSNIQQEVNAGSLTGQLINAYYNHHRFSPHPSEIRSWENSIKALVRSAEQIPSKDVGVIIEYHLPYSFSRIDAMLFGKNAEGAYSTAIVELKQWSEAKLIDADSMNVLVQDRERLHPSQQALGYAEHLEEIHSAMAECEIHPYPCAYCHNMPIRKTTLEDERFTPIIEQAPLFKQGEQEDLASYLTTSIGNGAGRKLMDKFSLGRFKPNKKLLAVLDDVLQRDERWHLIDNQQLAYNAIWAHVLALKKNHNKNDHHAVVVKGGPGTGKSVIATQLLADAVRNDFTAAHSTGGKAFSTTLRSKFKGAARLFIYNMNMRDENGFDLILVDEAHRIRRNSETRFRKRRENPPSQIEELLNASRISVFFLDDNQSVRPDEVGSTDLILDTAEKLDIPVQVYDLHAQFRCGACEEYLKWIEYLFGFSSEIPEYWGDQYDFSLVDSPNDLENIVKGPKDASERNRLVAGFCWDWSDPLSDGSLIPDVVIDDWKRPWNAKPTKSSYPPEKHPYTLWADSPEGADQIGCIYSAQGLEFDRVGVIWGEDLVWRGDRWVAQREKSFDRPVRAKTVDTQKYLRNAYRVLMTRGIAGTQLLCLDDETREHVAERLEEIRQ